MQPLIDRPTSICQYTWFPGTAFPVKSVFTIHPPFSSKKFCIFKNKVIFSVSSRHDTKLYILFPQNQKHSDGSDDVAIAIRSSILFHHVHSRMLSSFAANTKRLITNDVVAVELSTVYFYSLLMQSFNFFWQFVFSWI